MLPWLRHQANCSAWPSEDALDIHVTITWFWFDCVNHPCYCVLPAPENTNALSVPSNVQSQSASSQSLLCTNGLWHMYHTQCMCSSDFYRQDLTGQPLWHFLLSHLLSLQFLAETCFPPHSAELNKMFDNHNLGKSRVVWQLSPV